MFPNTRSYLEPSPGGLCPGGSVVDSALLGSCVQSDGWEFLGSAETNLGQNLIQLNFAPLDIVLVAAPGLIYCSYCKLAVVL